MIRPILVLLSLCALSFVALPAADASPLSCQVSVWDWWEHVHCGAGSTFVNSDESWCPNDPDIQCTFFPILECTGSLLTPCTIL
jgi:hypothetical protein